MRSEILIVVLVLASVVGVVSRLLYRKLRMRRAIRLLVLQVRWSLRCAPRNNLVLEVGSGHNPHVRADVLCDRYLADDTHRSSGVNLDRPFVVGDAANLPFRSGSFDSILSSHMIEHLPDPEGFFGEASRVARAGRFRAPSALREMILGDPQHVWSISYDQDGGLVFVPKSEPLLNPELQAAFWSGIARDIQSFDRFLLDNWDVLEIVYDWCDAPAIRVLGDGTPQEFVSASLDEPKTTRELLGWEMHRDRLRSLVRRVGHRLLSSRKSLRWVDILICPLCGGSVSERADRILCVNCDSHYPIVDGIPHMLVEYAVVGDGAIEASSACGADNREIVSSD